MGPETGDVAESKDESPEADSGLEEDEDQPVEPDTGDGKTPYIGEIISGVELTDTESGTESDENIDSEQDLFEDNES